MILPKRYEDTVIVLVWITHGEQTRISRIVRGGRAGEAYDSQPNTQIAQPNDFKLTHNHHRTDDGFSRSTVVVVAAARLKNCRQLLLLLNVGRFIITLVIVSRDMYRPVKTRSGFFVQSTDIHNIYRRRRR